MPGSERLTATVSTKGRIVLPKAVRAPRRWGAGTRLVVENTPDGVLLKSAHGGACAALLGTLVSRPHFCSRALHTPVRARRPRSQDALRRGVLGEKSHRAHASVLAIGVEARALFVTY